MVHTGGLGYAIDVSKPTGQRISDMTLLVRGSGRCRKDYVVAGWASINQATEGRPSGMSSPGISKRRRP